VVIRLATPAERETIYQLRHDVYAQELGQHAINAEGRLTDALDAFNIYLVAADGDRILGFISVTPPGAGRYSIDKYFRRDQLPFPVDDRLYEIRLLTLLPEARGWFLALGLMWAAFRYIESRGATRFAVIGREEVLSIYFRVGLKLAGLQTQAGAVIYHLMHATMQDVHNTLDDIGRQLGRIEANVRWEVGVPFWTPAPCYHGGEFFKAVGEGFDCLDRRKGIINADVLDAWFPPAPGVLAALERDLPWLVQTSPPTGCEGMVRAIARARGVPVESILPGGGSSDLIFRALRHWLTRESRVLLLDPTYGEYGHVLERVVGCHVDRWPLARAQGYRLDVRQLPERVRGGYHLVVLVNPNSPTGEAVPREELESALGAAPASTRVWVDETYVDYLGPDQSIERFAAHSENVVVCKSMSKVYALSGMRVAYLCAGGHQLEGLRAITPPWVVGLPGQLAAVRALEDPAYYAARWLETHGLRESLAAELRALGWDLLPGSANFLLCHVPADGPDAATWISRCQEHGLWLRSASAMSPLLGDRAIRVAVKDAATNRRMVEILRVVGQGTG
jgi:histidinol-phosphate/aromatic aminotransferase/cobyric acid decarboxylase-like protein